MLIFEHSSKGRRGAPQSPAERAPMSAIPENLLRKESAPLPEVSELQAVRHYTRLSQKNFSIDTEFYPLGSCTMKYNPRACNSLAMLPGSEGYRSAWDLTIKAAEEANQPGSFSGSRIVSSRSARRNHVAANASSRTSRS